MAASGSPRTTPRPRLMKARVVLPAAVSVPTATTYICNTTIMQSWCYIDAHLARMAHSADGR